MNTNLIFTANRLYENVPFHSFAGISSTIYGRIRGAVQKVNASDESTAAISNDRRRASTNSMRGKTDGKIYFFSVWKTEGEVSAGVLLWNDGTENFIWSLYSLWLLLTAIAYIC